VACLSASARGILSLFLGIWWRADFVIFALFSVVGAHRFPSAMDGKEEFMQTLFSVHADGNLCAQSTIFRP